MKLRSYLMLTSAAVVILVLGVFAFQAQRVVAGGMTQIASAQDQQISQIIQSAIEARFAVMRNFNRILRSDNDLSGAYLLANETKDNGLIQGKLQRVRENGGFDVAEILPFRKGEPEGFSLQTVGAKPSLVYSSPIEHYGASVAKLVIGYHLDGSIKSELETLTHSTVDMAEVTKPTNSEGVALITIPASSSPTLGIRFVPREPIAQNIGARVIYNTLLVGAFCLALLIALFYFVLEVGFVRKFNHMAGQAESIADSISQGEVPRYESEPCKIAETAILNRVLSRLVSSIHDYQKRIEKKSATEAEAKKKIALAEMARDVAHNIRSPLVAAENTVPRLVGVPDDIRRVLSSAVREIRVLTDSLKAQSASDKLSVPVAVQRKNLEKASIQHISSVVDGVVSEKRIECAALKEIEIKYVCAPDAFSVFASIPPSAFRIAISNLINNAVEALPLKKGKVTVICSRRGTSAAISVADTGAGIQPEVLSRIGERGATFGKDGGSGLGLSHARELADTVGGKLLITTEPGKGTEVTLEIPSASPPEWFVDSINVNDKEVIVLDDDSSIHALWDIKLKRHTNVSAIHFKNGDEFAVWVKGSTSDRPRAFFVDCELLGQAKTGLDLIAELKIEKDSVLVTGCFDEPNIVARVSWLGVKMLPKPLLGAVPFVRPV